MKHQRDAVAAMLLSAVALGTSSLIHRHGKRDSESSVSSSTGTPSPPSSEMDSTEIDTSSGELSESGTDKRIRRHKKPASRSRANIVAETAIVRVLLLAVLAIVVVAKDFAWHGSLALLVLTCLELIADYWTHRHLAARHGSSKASVKFSNLFFEIPIRPAHPSTSVDPRLSGTWIKVPELSDSQLPSLEILQLGGLAKQAVKLFRGVRLCVDRGDLEMTGLSHIPFINAKTEKYSLEGKPSQYPRRDMRKGKHTGVVQFAPDGTLSLSCHWEDPLRGTATDEFVMKNEHELHIITTISVGNQSCRYTVVYHRQTR